MTLSDFTMRYAASAFGVGVRWLREELSARGVSVRLTEACLREFAMDAAADARLETSTGGARDPFTTSLRRKVAARAEFVRAWTRSDDRLDAADPSVERLTNIARKYALPRAWSLSEPTASVCRHPTPTYLYWARAS
jgi:hypothetical protein